MPYENGKMKSRKKHNDLLKYNLKNALYALNISFSDKARTSNEFLKSMDDIDQSDKIVETIISNLTKKD